MYVAPEVVERRIPCQVEEPDRTAQHWDTPFQPRRGEGPEPGPGTWRVITPEDSLPPFPGLIKFAAIIPRSHALGSRFRPSRD